MIVAIPHIEKHSHPKLIRDRDAKTFLHSSSGREKIIGFTGDLTIQPYSIDTDIGWLPAKPWHPVGECSINREGNVLPPEPRPNSAKHGSIDYDYAHKQPHSKVRLERQIDKICRYQYKKKHLQSYKQIPPQVKKALMGIEEKQSNQPDVSSPYFAIRSWLLETAPDPELKKWIQETKTDSEVRWMLIQEEALHRASQTTMPDPELKRWAKKERDELERRIEAKAKLKRREDTNEMIKREELAREEKRVQSYQQQAAKRLAIFGPHTESAVDRMIDNTMDSTKKSDRKKSQILYFDTQGIASLQTHAANMSCKSLNKINETDTLYNKRDSISVAVASSGKDLEVNARRRVSTLSTSQRPQTAGAAIEVETAKPRVVQHPIPSPLADTASRGRIRPQTAGAKLQTERPAMLPANYVRVDDLKTSMALAAVDRIVGNSHDDADDDDADIDDDSMNTGGKPCAVKRSSTTHRERSLADRLRVYHLPTVANIPTSTKKVNVSEAISHQSDIHDLATLRQRPQTAGAALSTNSRNRSKRDTSRPRSVSPVNQARQSVNLQDRPNTAGERLANQLTNGYEYSLPVVTHVSNIGEKNNTAHQLPAQTKRAYTGTRVSRPASAPSVVPVHDYDGYKNHTHSSKGDDRRPHSALFRNALRSSSPKVDPKEKELQQLQQMFGKDLIYRLDSVFAPKQPAGNQRTKVKAKLTSWRI